MKIYFVYDNKGEILAIEIDCSTAIKKAKDFEKKLHNTITVVQRITNEDCFANNVRIIYQTNPPYKN